MLSVSFTTDTLAGNGSRTKCACSACSVRAGTLAQPYVHSFFLPGQSSHSCGGPACLVAFTSRSALPNLHSANTVSACSRGVTPMRTKRTWLLHSLPLGVPLDNPFVNVRLPARSVARISNARHAFQQRCERRDAYASATPPDGCARPVLLRGLPARAGRRRGGRLDCTTTALLPLAACATPRS